MWYEVVGVDAKSKKPLAERMFEADCAAIARRLAFESGMLPQIAMSQPRYCCEDFRLYFSTFEEFKTAVSSALPARIRHLHLGFMDPCALDVLAILAASKHVKAIKKIHFGHQKIGSAEMEVLCGSSNLRGLESLGFFWLLENAVEVLANSSAFKNLRSLQVKGEWSPVREGLNALGHSSSLTKLESLAVHTYSDLTPKDLSEFAASPLMSRLICLDLGQNRKLGEKGVATLASSKNAVSLTYLNLNDVNLKAKGAELLSLSPYLANMEELHLWGNHIGPAGCKSLAESNYLTKLTHLELSNNNIGDEGLGSLSVSPILDRVAILGLSYNQIGLEGVRSLEKSKHLSALQVLELSNNKIGMEGTRLFAASSLHGRLREVSLDGNESEEDKRKTREPSSTKIVKRFEPWLKSVKRWAWIPKVLKKDGSSTASKFGGIPWLRNGEAWPPCGECKGPMHFFFQIYLNKLPREVSGRFGEGMLQFFHCLKEGCLYGKYCQDPFTPCMLARIVVVGKSGVTTTIPDYEGAPAFSPRLISGWKKVADYPSEQDFEEFGLSYKNDKVECKELKLVIDDVDYDDFSQLRRCVKGDKLAGWADWVQIHTSYPQCTRCNKRMDTIVFNLGADDSIPFMFADGGHGPIVQCPDHKDVLGFSWDSG